VGRHWCVLMSEDDMGEHVEMRPVEMHPSFSVAVFNLFCVLSIHPFYVYLSNNQFR